MVEDQSSRRCVSRVPLIFSLICFGSSPTPPPPLPDFYVVEDTLSYTKKGEKKHFTVQNRHAQFKMVRISGVTAPFQCKARVMNMP